MRHLMYFEVEIRRPDTGNWEHAVSCEPKYVTIVEKRPYWVFWTKDYVVIVNLREAEDVARVNALMHAKTYRNRSLLLRREARVVRVEVQDGGEVRETIWQNGHFRD